MQKDKDTDVIRIGYESPKTPSRTFEYNLRTKEKKLVKEQEVPSGHNREDYIVERIIVLVTMEEKYNYYYISQKY